MNIHDYQAKELFDRFEVPSPRGQMAESAEAAQAIAEEIGSDLMVVKAQVHAGGCLLYTSPSPRDRTRSRMPSSA